MANHKHYAASCHQHRPMPVPTPYVKHDMPENFSLAMAYVPWQTWRDIYDNEKAFACGTIFQELNMPFCGKGGGKR